MIKVILRGRLGNILFQYAAGRNLALLNNDELQLDFIHYIKRKRQFWLNLLKQLSHFNLQASIYIPNPDEVQNYHEHRRRYLTDQIFTEIFPQHHPEVFHQDNKTAIYGFFQSEKYFSRIADTIKQDLVVETDSFGSLYAEYRKKIDQLQSVAVHIRLGDYNTASHLGTPDMHYYKSAMDIFRERLCDPRFFVFSDDIPWCRERLIGHDINFIEISTARNNPIIDFELMRSCSYFIISNSTYSWWAAWLSDNPDKHIIAPGQWHYDPTTNGEFMKHILPPSWETIPNTLAQ